MPQLTNIDSHLLALDVGDKRVGVAIASTKTMLAKPLITLTNDSQLIPQLNQLVKDYQVTSVIVGLPRSLNGQDTQQTNKVRLMIDQLSSELAIEIKTQDEALSSVRAEEELASRGKIHAKADIDKLAACLILEDYIVSQKS